MKTSRYIYALLSATVSVCIYTGCTGAFQGGTISGGGGPAPASHAVGLTVRDAHGPIAGAICGLEGATDQGVVSNANGTIIFPHVPLSLHATQLTCHADGYVDFSEHRDLTGAEPEPTLVAMMRPLEPAIALLPSKADFYRRFQANFGGIELPGCGLRNDILFDPQLLPMFLFDKPCFERGLLEHARRNDTVVVVSPAICYHEGYAGACADVWHEPARFREFLTAIRSHRNAAGELLEALVIFVQGEHEDWYPLLQDAREGVPDRTKEAHVMRDLEMMAPATQDLIAGTAPAWEPRHQRDWMTAGQLERIAARVAALWPEAWHGQHLIKESSSWSSWRCDPLIDSSCDPSNVEGDDPNRGNEPRAWVRCRGLGWCDGFLYQIPDGPKFLNPVDGDAANDWKDRAREIAERLGAGGRGWPKVDLVWFEFIYDRFNGRASEQLLERRCREAQAIFMAPCGSASVRMQ